MTDGRLMVPPMDAEPFPTLGWQVISWIEKNLVHGPGDVKGLPVRLNDEQQAFILRCYEVFPPGHARAGRRRFKRCAFSRRKGFSKTEGGAFIAIAEMDPTAPVRTLFVDGVAQFECEDGEIVPVGTSVRDPYIPMIATTEEQSADLAFGAVREILMNCELGNHYVITEEKVVHSVAPGMMRAMASAPGAREGARTSFQYFDEPHLYLSERLKSAHETMLRNIPKRYESDAWTLETGTMYGPGEGSIAEATHAYALAVLEGQVEDSSLLYDHLEATLDTDLSLRKIPLKQLRAAVEEASGAAFSFADVDAIIGQLQDPRTDEADFRRYWLNQRVRSSKRWLHVDAIKARFSERKLMPGEEIVLGFDGSRTRDSTALVAATVQPEPHIAVLGHWERPLRGVPDWRVPNSEVEDAIQSAFQTYTVVELAPDPWGWWKEIEEWEAMYGDVVVRFETNTRPAIFGPACDAMAQAVTDGTVTFQADEAGKALVRHFGNCVAVKRSGYTVVTKESNDSPNKIDLAVGAILAHSRARFRNTVRPDPVEFMAAYG